MIEKITTYLLTKNNQTTIDAALQSISWLKGPIIVGDMGSNDKTIEICRRYNTVVVPVVFQDNYSRAKNKLLDSGESLWQLYVEPWEQILTGHRAIIEAAADTKPHAYYLQILTGQTIAKEIRLWNKQLRFTNPVFENVTDSQANLLEPVIIHSKGGIDKNETERLLSFWKKADPISNEPYYYQAYQFLQNKKYREFASLAEQYITTSKKGISAVMIRYYLAMVNLHVLGNSDKAIRNIIECIAARPLMAEFWCLLADLHYKTNDYKKAISLYENAIILGSKRLKDEWPIEIPKYEEYPQKMINSCQSILQHTKVFASQ